MASGVCNCLGFFRGGGGGGREGKGGLLFRRSCGFKKSQSKTKTKKK